MNQTERRQAILTFDEDKFTDAPEGYRKKVFAKYLLLKYVLNLPLASVPSTVRDAAQYLIPDRMFDDRRPPRRGAALPYIEALFTERKEWSAEELREERAMSVQDMRKLLSKAMDEATEETVPWVVLNPKTGVYTLKKIGGRPPKEYLGPLPAFFATMLEVPDGETK